MRAIFIFIKVDLGRVKEVADKLIEVDEASEVYSVAGEYDILAKFYVSDLEALGEIIQTKVHTIPHIRETHTLITFNAFKTPHIKVEETRDRPHKYAPRLVE